MAALAVELLDALVSATPLWPFDRYRSYPARDPEAWQRFYVRRIDQFAQRAANTLRYEIVDGLPVLLGVRLSEWDSQHFGYGVASINLVHSQQSEASNRRCARLLSDILAVLRSEKIRFVAARLPGDMIPTIHIFEDAGFRYHETMIWPVAPCSDAIPRFPETVRLMREEDLPGVMSIAATSQDQRTHFSSDSGFDRQQLNRLYEKWIQTSWTNGEPIAVVEHAGRIAGYFNFKMDDALSGALGYSYGEMRLLALDGAARGQGLGRKLFHAAMSIMREMGGDYIHSSYASNNHLSARLHDISGFHSAYEEVTLHLWL